MQALESALTFVIETISLAGKSPSASRKLVASLIGWCAAIAVLGGAAVGMAVWLIPGTVWESIAVGILVALMLAGFYASGRIHQPAVCRLLGDLLQDRAPEQTEWKAALRRHGTDNLLLETATLVTILRGQRNGHKSSQLFPSESSWQQARYLVTPTASLESLELHDSLLRVSQMVNDHLPRIAPALLKVNQLTAILSVSISLTGILFGASLGMGLADLGGTAWQAAGAGIGAGLAGLFTGAGLAFRMVILASYHTSLYLWARRTGQARLAGSPDEVVIPAPLAAAFDHRVV